MDQANVIRIMVALLLLTWITGWMFDFIPQTLHPPQPTTSTALQTDPSPSVLSGFFHYMIPTFESCQELFGIIAAVAPVMLYPLINAHPTKGPKAVSIAARCQVAFHLFCFLWGVENHSLLDTAVWVQIGLCVFALELTATLGKHGRMKKRAVGVRDLERSGRHAIASIAYLCVFAVWKMDLNGWVKVWCTMGVMYEACCFLSPMSGVGYQRGREGLVSGIWGWVTLSGVDSYPGWKGFVAGVMFVVGEGIWVVQVISFLRGWW